jgi:CheY-like chemotaxis protein
MEKQSPQQTVLIVDDQPMNVDILYDVLRSNYRVKVALNGEQALNITSSHSQPDLILLDIMMPGMDGYEVCRRLKANPFTRSIPVIFVTAMADVVDESKGFELGAVDYITKPFSPPLVQARVRAQLALYDQSRSLEEMVRRRTAELQRANLRLAQERSRFEWVVRTAQDGYLILDQEGRILFANEQARIYLDLPPDLSPVHDTFMSLVKRQYQLESSDAWSAPLNQTSSQPRYLIRPETSTAQAFWISVEILPMSEDDPEKHWVVRLQDVTEQINTWSNWGAFSEMVSHKLRTPMSIAMTSVELLANHCADLPVEEVMVTASFAQKGIQRLSKTIEDVLAYMDTPVIAVTGEGFALNELQPLTADIAESLEIDNIGVASTSELVNCNLVLSRRAFERILWELLENSRKFHPKKAPRVEILVLPTQEGKACIQVREQTDQVNFFPGLDFHPGDNKNAAPFGGLYGCTCVLRCVMVCYGNHIQAFGLGCVNDFRRGHFLFRTR